MITDKKTGIIYKEWKAASADAVFLLVHGLGAHTGRWIFLADFFLKRNISSYAIELRGFGETKGLKGHIDSFKTYLNDIAGLREIIAKENKGKKIFLIGESVGGLISFLTASVLPDFFAGLISISPAFASKLKATPLAYFKTLAPLIYNPKKQFPIPFDSKMCTRDTEYQRTMNSDLREHRLATSRFIFELIKAQLSCNIFSKIVDVPVLFLLSGNDKLVIPEATRRVFNRLRAKDKKIIEYPRMYHALSIDLDKEKVFNDILDWVEKRI
ncbi:MAG: alpha/beta hydrolase [Candidatus Omnitrophica bacterium]|nr:alpha/beta hydrolase [Candidatus Omnitrophota bacterium]